MSFTPITVTRRYLTGALTPATGQVRFTPTVPMVNDDTVVAGPSVGVLDAEGDLTIVLAANDDPATEPEGVTYLVREEITGQPRRQYYVVIPYDAAGGTIDLAGLNTLTVPPVLTFPAPGPQGPAGIDGDDGAPGPNVLSGATDVDVAGAAAGLPLVVDTTGPVTWSIGGAYQPLDDELTMLSGLTPVADNFLVGTAGPAWSVRTPTQARAALVLDRVDNSSVIARSISVHDYGALGDDVADDTAELQAAIDAAPPGGIVFLPPGRYRTSVPLILRPNVTLLGAHGDTLTYADSAPSPTAIRPLPGFVGAAVVRVVDATTGGYGLVKPTGTRIEDITIDGSSCAVAGVSGVQLYGYVREFTATEVCCRELTGDGFATTGHGAFTGDARAPLSNRFRNCVADNCTGAGFVITGPDTTLIDCNAQGCDYVGFYLSGAPNSQLIGCRAEWSLQHNYLITGSWGTGQGSGGVEMIGCLSDRANWNGVYVNSTGAGTHSITGMHFRRDGRNGGSGGGGYAAIFVDDATTPVVVSNVVVYPGVDDGGTGTNSPQRGVHAEGSTHVVVSSGYVHAATTAVSDGGANGHYDVSPVVGRATGTTAAPVRVKPWTAAPAAPRQGAGRYIFTSSPAAAATSNALGISTARVAPWLVERPLPIDRIGSEVAMVGDAGSKFRLMIYADDGTGQPGALVLDGGTINGDSATVQETTVAVTLAPGLYWIGGAVQVVTTTQPTMRIGSGWTPPIEVPGLVIPGANAAAVGVFLSGFTGAAPGTFGGGYTATANVPRVFVRTA